MSADAPDTSRSSRRRLLWLSAGIVAVLVCIGFTIVRVLAGGPTMVIVTSVDQQGNLVGVPTIESMPKPVRVSSQGLGRLESFVARMMASQARFTSLAVFSLDGQRGLGLHYTGGKVSLSLSVDWRRRPARERAIRRLFNSLQIPPTQDYLAGNGPVPDATRVLEYPLTGDSAKVAQTCRRVLREIFGVTDEEGLDFSYQEHR